MADTKEDMGIWLEPMPEATYALKLQVCNADGTWDYIYIYTDANTPEDIDLNYVRRWSFSPLGLPALGILAETIWFHSIVSADVAFADEYGDILDEEVEMLRKAMLTEMFQKELESQELAPSEQELINHRDAQNLSEAVKRHTVLAS